MNKIRKHKKILVVATLFILMISIVVWQKNSSAEDEVVVEQVEDPGHLADLMEGWLDDSLDEEQIEEYRERYFKERDVDHPHGYNYYTRNLIDTEASIEYPAFKNDLDLSVDIDLEEGSIKLESNGNIKIERDKRSIGDYEIQIYNENFEMLWADIYFQSGEIPSSQYMFNVENPFVINSEEYLIDFERPNEVLANAQDGKYLVYVDLRTEKFEEDVYFISFGVEKENGDFTVFDHDIYLDEWGEPGNEESL